MNGKDITFDVNGLSSAGYLAPQAAKLAWARTLEFLRG
jgi:hypothetical protein